jgi:hypothetical protein
MSPLRVKRLHSLAIAGALLAALFFHGLGSSTTYISPEWLKAFLACIAQWETPEGRWEGLLKNGGDGRHFRAVYVRLVFREGGVRFLTRQGQTDVWQPIGEDPRPRFEYDKITLAVQGNSPRLEGHLVFLQRLSETAASVTYVRAPLNPASGEAVMMTNMMSGVIVREGFPTPTGLAADLGECRGARPYAGR